jgi:hypothetical protein
MPLNEACWNGKSYVAAAYAGANCQSAIEAYVKRLNSNGIVAISDLQWSDGRQDVGGDRVQGRRRRLSSTCSTNRTRKSLTATIRPRAGSAGWLHGGSDCVGIAYPVAGIHTRQHGQRDRRRSR